MIRHNRSRRGFGVAVTGTTLILTLALAGCASSSSSKSTTAPSGGTLTVAELAPPSLIPGQNDGAASDELNALFAPLTYYTASGQLEDIQASSIVGSDGQRVWTIHLRPGWTFSDGEAVTAQSYINAWNATAYGPNAWVDGGDFSDVQGYAALNPPSGKPTVKTLSGLSAPNSLTIRVALTSPDSQFPLELTTSAFLPMPSAAFKDLTAYASDPIGDGQYMMAGPEVPNVSITVVRYPGYKGVKGHAAKVVFQIYTSTSAMYTAAEAGQVDIASVGQSQYGAAKKAFGKNFIAFNAPAIDYIGFPLYNNKFPKLVREAFSLAINRTLLNAKIFAGVNQPATSILPPAEAGAPTNICKYCKYDPSLARKLLAEAGGWHGPLVIWYPSGAGYSPTWEAIANMLHSNLGIGPITFNASPFTPYLAALAGKKVTNGIYRGHWGAYFPSMENTLANLFEPQGAGYTETYYSSPTVQSLIAKGNAAPTLAKAEAFYRQAETAIMSAFPVIPLDYAKYVYVHTSAVSNVVIDVEQVNPGQVIVNKA